ncbi:histidine phosphatase superfamily [Dipodascopsis tothii]|uniref:histidine phosphatase superfamily n=1 Tax=Dipodascopsis tothii TaxID=44089 RepID=UPI0034CF3661
MVLKSSLLAASTLVGSAVAASYSQASTEEFNLLRHLGGNGPYVQHHGYGLSREAPESCTIDQVHMLSRHGERYQTASKGASEKKVVDRLLSADVTPTGPLSFLSTYTWPATDADYEEETTMGPYAGTLDAFSVGTEYRARYGALYDDSEIMPIFASEEERVVVTAHNFAQGFLGVNYSDYSEFQIIPEDVSRGANTLTWKLGCNNYNKTLYSDYIDSFSDDYAVQAADRLNTLAPGYNITSDEVVSLMTLCGYELNIRANDDFCKLFTPDEFVAFGYSRDLAYYYQYGQGNNLTDYIGSVYANATATLLEQGPSVGKMFWSFTHDDDMISVFYGLGLFETPSLLPAEYVQFGSPFQTSEIVPMGGRIVIERLNCSGHAYARIVVNEAVIPITSCQSGPGYSCPVTDFKTFVNKRAPKTYGIECGLDDDVPWHMWFYWNWNK